MSESVKFGHIRTVKMSESVRESIGLGHGHDFGHGFIRLGGRVKKKRAAVLYKFGAEKRMELSTPVASTPLAQRMLDAMGPDDFSVLKTFQEQFGGKLVHYQDQAGEVGKKPEWLDG